MGWGSRGRVVLVAAVLGLLTTVVAGCAADHGVPSVTGTAAPPAPTTTVLTRTTTASPAAEVIGPIIGGTYGVPYNPLPPALAEEFDYVESEFLVAGEAVSYTSVAPLATDGRWTVTQGPSAPYRTRLLVRRPADADDFNGTVVVEWLNVTSGMDSDATFGQAHPELLRSGYAWVGVSAQAVGVVGGGARIPIEGLDPRPLREWDPARYGTLAHPGDAHSYDIFTQAAQVLRAPGAVDPLAGLEPQVVLAAGESQSAGRLVTYIDAVHPVAPVFDGFLVHSRGRSGAPLGPEPSAVPIAGTRIRDDLGVPVLQVQMETDVLRLGSFEARQPDSALLRTWEVAGTAHADRNTLDYGLASGSVWNPASAIDLSALCGSINDGPQTYALRRAVDALDRWVRDGELPPSTDPIEVVAGAIARDDLGIARGGIRLPAVEAPVATITGDPPAGSSVICSLFGSSTPLPADVVAERYPDPDAYVDAVERAASTAVDAGVLLEVDADEIVEAAR